MICHINDMMIDIISLPPLSDQRAKWCAKDENNNEFSIHSPAYDAGKNQGKNKQNLKTKRDKNYSKF